MWHLWVILDNVIHEIQLLDMTDGVYQVLDPNL